MIKNDVVFILGAGFNVDAVSEADYQKPLLISGLSAHYPLVADLLEICFKEDTNYVNKSIEDLFQDSIDEDDKTPLIKLYDYLMELDWCITPYLKRKRNNAYLRFLRDFSESHLITFNYDSLLEILLLAEGSWFPGDGYGVPVQFNMEHFRGGTPPEGKTLRHVLHLHGSLCVYTEDFSIEKQPGSWCPILQECEPKFLFDPDKLWQFFSPFLRIFPSITSYTNPYNRIIAPIPNKAEGLKSAFIKAVYDKAIQYLNNAN